jgi:hypothetical protein
MAHQDETEILSDEQIEEGSASAEERPWRVRLATAQARQDLLVGIQERWAEADLAQLEASLDDPDRFVREISRATRLTPEAVEDELDNLARI